MRDEGNNGRPELAQPGDSIRFGVLEQFRFRTFHHFFARNAILDIRVRSGPTGTRKSGNKSAESAHKAALRDG